MKRETTHGWGGEGRTIAKTRSREQEERCSRSFKKAGLAWHRGPLGTKQRNGFSFKLVTRRVSLWAEPAEKNISELDINEKQKGVVVGRREKNNEWKKVSSKCGNYGIRLLEEKGDKCMSKSLLNCRNHTILHRWLSIPSRQLRRGQNEKIKTEWANKVQTFSTCYIHGIYTLLYSCCIPYYTLLASLLAGREERVEGRVGGTGWMRVSILTARSADHHGGWRNQAKHSGGCGRLHFSTHEHRL